MNNDLIQAALELEEQETQASQAAVSIQDLDKRLAELKYLKDEVDKVGEVYDKYSKQFDQKKKELYDILQSVNRDRHQLDGIGTLYPVEKGGFKMPADLEDKRKLFNFIQARYGNDTLAAMLVIKDAELNKFVKTEIENGSSVPGVGEFQSFKQITFRKGK